MPSRFTFELWTQRFLLGLTLILWVARCPAASDPFAEGIRPTPWQSPADEQKAFQLPPGFEIQLVAAEPEIHKPLNLAFDVLGRLWVTTSIEYPIAAPTNQPGRDRIMIFEDFGPDGKARKVTEFANGLNIPIGIYPFQSPRPNGPPTWKAVVWSIPNIYLFEDTDGDGRADKREVLYANFDYTRDTHGNQASFRRGFDGWLYCTHGYNNDSHVRGTDGQEVHMNSGNTYRLRLDGSHIDHYTHGQVNPFGMAFDAFGDLFASDCHSEPMYQILAGGYYPSFGKPHDGLGFVPKMMENKRGSTAIDGLSLYSDTLWPEEFRGNVFIGDVMTSRVYRDRLVERGSSRIAQARPDLVSTSDPWFRPVDTQLGPDGAIYIADFYNRIIGHYEVPLGHPGRDRTSGRIWRVRYRGEPDRPMALKPGLDGLLEELRSPNLTRRLLAMNQIVDVFATPEHRAQIDQAGATFQANGEALSHWLWMEHRLGWLSKSALRQSSRHSDRLVRTHVQRILTDSTSWDSEDHSMALSALKDSDALVRRCALEGLAKHPALENVRVLLDFIPRIPAADTHLLYVARKSLRDHLNSDAILEATTRQHHLTAHTELLADLCLSVPTSSAARFLLSQWNPERLGSLDAPRPLEWIRHIARYGGTPQLEALEQILRNWSQKSVTPRQDGFSRSGRSLTVFKSFDEGLQESGRSLPESLRQWGASMVTDFLQGKAPDMGWSPLPFDRELTSCPWGLESRMGEDGHSHRLISSRPYGEELTGVIQSKPFVFPENLEFWFCGQDGYLNAPAPDLMQLQLRSVSSGRVLAQMKVPRSDLAKRVQWRIPEAVGQSVYLEAVDGNDNADFAWMAFGEFHPNLEALNPPSQDPRQTILWTTTAAETAVRVGLKSVAPQLEALCLPTPAGTLPMSDPEAIGTLTHAWLTLDSATAAQKILTALQKGIGPTYYRERLAQTLISLNDPTTLGAVVQSMKSFPQLTQERLSYPLATLPLGAEALLTGMENGVVSPRVLQRVGVVNRLRASHPKDWETRVAALKKKFPAEDDARDRLIATLKSACITGSGDAMHGKQVFSKYCTPCHRIGDQGALIGPQLDGIGQRGLDRLCEDILDPNRSVDRAFRVTLLTLKSQDVVSGLLRRDEGELLVVADSTGKEVRVPKSDVQSQRESDTSLMPDNFGEVMTQTDFVDLTKFLLSTAFKSKP